MSVLQGVLIFVAVSSLHVVPASADIHFNICEPEQWRCDDGRCLPTSAVCDGALDCDDGSDETLARCKHTRRPLLGLILHCSLSWSPRHGKVCPEVCHLWPEYCYYALAAEHGAPGACILPALPEYGNYSIADVTTRESRDESLADFTLVYSCAIGLNLVGNNPRCVNGTWTDAFPRCNPDKCHLREHASVTYRCVNRASLSINSCPSWVPNGQRVLPECRRDFVHDAFEAMKCSNGSWNYVATCRRDCGIPAGIAHISHTLSRGQLPWYAAVYTQRSSSIEQICGGSIVSKSFVISAAHCFWDEASNTVRNTSNFQVVAGVLRRSWYEREDGRQKCSVIELIVPPGYRGRSLHYHHDLALIMVSPAIVFTSYVKPVCLDFDSEFDGPGSVNGSYGLVPTWGLEEDNLDASTSLQAAGLALVDRQTCIRLSTNSAERFLSRDKVCAHYINGTKLYMGDSGSGFVSPSGGRFYLRGITSVALSSSSDSLDIVNSNVVSFTRLGPFEQFIKNASDVI